MREPTDDDMRSSDLRSLVLSDFVPLANPSDAEELVSVCRPLLPKAAKIMKYFEGIDDCRRYSNHGGLVVAMQSRLREAVKGMAEIALASSGTSALAGAILASAGRASLERPLCLLPAYTFIGTVSAVEQCGFTPYFIDVDPHSWMIAPQQCLDHSLIDQVGLIVPVAPYGRAVEQSGWSAFQQQTGIPVVIDGAACFESLITAPEVYLGAIPVAVSFHATKSFCTGEGGGVFCNNPMVWRAAVQCLNFGYDQDRVCRRPSLNGKMSEYHAAVGLAELDGWDFKRKLYRHAARRYLAGSTGLKGRLHTAPRIASNYALFEADTVEEADLVCRALSKSRIGFRKWYGAGVHMQPYCQGFGRDPLPHAESLAQRLIGIPMSIDIDSGAIDYVLDVLSSFAAPAFEGVGFEPMRSRAVQQPSRQIARPRTSIRALS